MWRVVAEWAPGLFRAQIGGLGLEKFGPYHFRILYTHINQIMKKKKKSNFSKKIARELFYDITTHTNISSCILSKLTTPNFII